MFGLVFSIFFQELFRYFIYVLLSKADAYLKKLTENENTRIFANKHILAYGKLNGFVSLKNGLHLHTFVPLVVGLGFGMMSGAFSLVNVLADSLGPGTVGFNGEPQDFFMVSALLGMPMIFLNTFWGIITFNALDKRKWVHLAFVWGSHLLVSCLVSDIFSN